MYGEHAGDAFLLFEIEGEKRMIDYLEEPGEGEVIDQDLIELGREGRRRFLNRFPLRKDDGNLDESGSIDVEIDPCLDRWDEEGKQNKDIDKIFNHLSIRGKTDSDLQALLVQFFWNGRQGPRLDNCPHGHLVIKRIA